ncbi:MAG: hypothetical protein PHW31_02545 [Candidatus Pacebacteria bacterium]|nr:hypothetical protein [Candidatus Paceibacterota bacterium]
MIGIAGSVYGLTLVPVIFTIKHMANIMKQDEKDVAEIICLYGE